MPTAQADRPRTDELTSGDVVWHGRSTDRIEIVSVDPRGSDLRFQGRQPDRTFSHELGSYIVAKDIRTGEERTMHAAPSLRWTRA